MADLPAEEQMQTLDSLCAGEPEVRAQVKSLLAWDSESSKPIEQAVREEAFLLCDVDSLAGKRVGCV